MQALAHSNSMQVLFTSNTAQHDRGPSDHSHDITNRLPDLVYNIMIMVLIEHNLFACRPLLRWQ